MAGVRWLLATRNAGKIRELRAILADTPIELVGLDDLGIEEESPETGSGFTANAKQKAAFYQARAGIPTLADDSGLEVDALDGAPGIHSARFGGFETHAEKRAYLLGLLAGLPPEMRTARFVCAAVFFDGASYLCAEGTQEGYIGMQSVGDGGFGYDPLFHKTWGGPSNAELDMKVKNETSHRGLAFRRLMTALIDGGRLESPGQKAL